MDDRLSLREAWELMYVIAMRAVRGDFALFLCDLVILLSRRVVTVVELLPWTSSASLRQSLATDRQDCEAVRCG